MLPTIISYANNGYRDFSENLLRNIRDVIRNHNTVFYCLDSALYTALMPYSSDRVEIRLYTQDVASTVSTYGTTSFNRLTHTKISVLRDALRRFGFIHFVDADVVFCKEPTVDYYSKYMNYDIVYQRDAPPPNAPFHVWTCTGNFTLRNTGGTLKLLKDVEDIQDVHPEQNDQDCQRLLFETSGITDIRNYPHASLTEFPMQDFTCGYAVLNPLVDIREILVFHANHVVGKDAKITLLRRMGKWYA